jgi:alpha-tubulin suppressor-like RCC1 family protein
MQGGGVRCWGNNSFGELGDGTTEGRSTPPTDDVLTDVQAIAAGARHVCELMASGGVRCWGSNQSGQLGDGTTLDRSAPTSDVVTGVQALPASPLPPINPSSTTGPK